MHFLEIGKIDKNKYKLLYNLYCVCVLCFPNYLCVVSVCRFKGKHKEEMKILVYIYKFVISLRFLQK